MSLFFTKIKKNFYLRLNQLNDTGRKEHRVDGKDCILFYRKGGDGVNSLY